jgi:hypothetical protein
MTTFELYPGEGLPVDIDYEEPGASEWAVTAEIFLAGVAVTPAPTAESISDTEWRVHVTKDHTLAMAGRRAILKITAVNPLMPNEPDVEEARLVIGPV